MNRFNTDPRQYLKIMFYTIFYALDFVSPSIGMTLATGTREEMEARKQALCNMSDAELEAILTK
jgi:hypothetical protein